MRLIFFCFCYLLLFSCSKPSAIRRQLTGSDSLVINFTAPGSSEVEKSMNTTEKGAIKKVIQYVDGKPGIARRCGYDGTLEFYNNGTMTGGVGFNLSPDSCRHFVMIIDDKLTPTVMTNEAADFLKSLEEGRAWY